jgi:hypothetical protein
MVRLLPLLLAASPLFAQDADTLDRIQRSLEETLVRRYETTSGVTLTEATRFLYGGYFSMSVLGADDDFGSTRMLRQPDLRLWADVARGGHRVYGRFRFSYQDFNSGDSWSGRGDEWVWPLADLYWYRFDSRLDAQARRGEDPGFNLWFQGGRQQVDWGAGLTLDERLYSAMFGGEFRSFALTGMVGVTPQETTTDYDPSRPFFDTDTDRLFWGFIAECTAISGHRPYLFVLGQQDNNGIPLSGIDYAYDSTYIGVGSEGALSGRAHYHAEFVYEFGNSMSDPFRTFPQTEEDVTAWAAVLGVVWIPPFGQEKALRFEAEILLASGDGDRVFANRTLGGNLSGTDDKAFNSFGFVYTGLALAPDLSNLGSLRLTGSLEPLGARTLGAGPIRVTFDLFLMMRMEPDGGVSFTAPAGNRFIGTELDFGLEWRAFSDATVELRYGIFIPGTAGFDSDPRHFFYVGASYGF